MMTRIILMFAALLMTSVVQAQVPPYVADPEGEAPLYKRKHLPPAGWMSADDRRLMALSTQPTKPAPDTVVMTRGVGGSIPLHQVVFAGYRLNRTKVELRGPCYSACTMLTTYVEKENLCIEEGAFMAFHAARQTMDGPINTAATIAMVQAFPPEIRGWIDRNGGVDKLPRDGFWTMYDRELWAFGYPRCN